MQKNLQATTPETLDGNSSISNSSSPSCKETSRTRANRSRSSRESSSGSISLNAAPLKSNGRSLSRSAVEDAEPLVPQLAAWMDEHHEAVARINDNLDEQAAILKRLEVFFPMV